MELSFTSEALHLPLLHASRHPSSTLNGVLLGLPSPSSPTSIQITQAIPLLHHYTSLSPMMEIGLEMTAAYAKEKGLEVVGYYQANEAGRGLGRVGERIVKTLKKEFEGAVGLEIVNERILSDQPFEGPEGITFKLPQSKLAALLALGAHETLGDFDDHLEDAGVDWLENKEATAAVKRGE